MTFTDQLAAVAALRRGEIDAAASTAIGNQALLARLDEPDLRAVDLTGPASPPRGAFSVGHHERDLATVLNTQLAAFIGSPEHRALMGGYGFSDTDVDQVVSHP